MKTSKCIGIALVLAVVLSVAAQIAPQPTVLPIGAAVVSEIKGQVSFASPQGDPVTAQRGSILTAESRIETAKGSVLLELHDGSQVLVRSDSSVVLRAPNEGKGFSLELFIGEILVKVQKRLGSAPSFRLGTPSAVITVRGTRFSVEVNKKRRTYVNVFEGLVEIEGLTQGSPHILVRPGFSTRVEENRSPEEPREIEPGEGIGREGGREGQGPGAERNQEDQQRSQPKAGTSGSEGKPD